MIVRELITKLGFDVDMNKIRAFDNAVNTAKRDVEALANKFKAVGEGFSSVGRKMSLFVSLPILGMGAAMIKAASDAEETETKFAVVFASVSEAAEATAERLVKSFGMSRTGAKQLLGDTGDLLTGFGFTGVSALDLSQKVNELAVDLASFTNFEGGAEGASKALTKALLGERESVKSLGIAILENDVKERIALMKSKGMRFETERQAKAYATLAIAQEQSKNAIGDFTRTSEGFANRFRTFKNRINDFAVAFGKIMLPAANALLLKFLKLAERIDDLSPKTKKMIIVLLGIAAAIGPILIIMGSLISLVGWLITSFASLKAAVFFLAGGFKAMTAMTSLWALKFALIALAITGVVIALGLLAEDVYTWVNGGDSLIGEMLGPWETYRDGIAAVFESIKSILKAFLLGDLTSFSAEMEIWAQTWKDLGSSIADSLEAALGPEVAGVLRKAGGMFVRFAELVGESLGQLFSDPKAYFKEWKDLLSDITLFEVRSGPGVKNPTYDYTHDVVTRGGLNPASSPAQSNLTSRSITVKSNVNLTLPDTTPAEQRRILKEDAQTMVEEAFSRTINQTLMANPVRE